MIGHALDVLIEKPGRHQGQIAGKSPYLQPVQMEGSLDRLGDIVRVEIVSSGSNSLFGRLLPDRPAREALR
jgi:tRNA-2-methylthio-N6-dimethylallyladenosine synthase